MPAAKQQPLAAVIEAVARSCRSRHPSFSNPELANAKNPDVVPGRVDIAMQQVIVSRHEPNKFDWLIPVIASEAKQSRVTKEELDCFVASSSQ
jgi:hypothetical protein